MTTPTHWWTMTAKKDLSWYGQERIYSASPDITVLMRSEMVNWLVKQGFVVVYTRETVCPLCAVYPLPQHEPCPHTQEDAA